MSNEDPSPLILGFVADLIFASRIEAAAEGLNYRLAWIENAAQVAPADSEESPGQFAERLEGRAGALLDQVTRWRPVLILFDLGNSGIPWRRWIPLLKTSPATRRIPLICYGSHVDVPTLQAAKSLGADAVLARSRFASDMPGLLKKYARIPDYPAIREACQGSLSALALKGLEEFNRGRYFEAHEELEAAWNEEASPAKELYRAILQVAVAYLQIERGNYPGAMKIFLRLRQWIDPLPERCRGVEVAQLRADAESAHLHLASLGPEHIAEFDRRLFKPVIYRQEPDEVTP